MRISLQRPVNLLVVVLLLGGLAIVALNQNSIEELGAEKRELMTESQNAMQLAQENQKIPRLRAEYQEAEKLREANQDLLKLRNEVRQLRREAEGLEKLKAENQRLLAAKRASTKPVVAALPVDFLPRAALADAGLETPEAAVQTFFWAMCEGNVERVSQTRLPAAYSPDVDPDEIVQQMINFTGFGIAGKKIISPDQVVLDVHSRIGGPVVPIKLQRVKNGWRLPPQ